MTDLFEMVLFTKYALVSDNRMEELLSLIINCGLIIGCPIDGVIRTSVRAIFGDSIESPFPKIEIFVSFAASSGTLKESTDDTGVVR
jgi:hypothetical protein